MDGDRITELAIRRWRGGEARLNSAIRQRLASITRTVSRPILSTTPRRLTSSAMSLVLYARLRETDLRT
jgi:hypothetical protein